MRTRMVGRSATKRQRDQGWRYIHEIDVDDEFGLETPIFLFGFSTLNRGVSCRSSIRVPTHFVVALGPGHSNDSVIQAMGRATFMGKAALKANGFKHVTILALGNDFIMSKKYQKFVLEVSRRLEETDEKLDDILEGNVNLLPDSANFQRHTPRRTGQQKGLSISNDAFEVAMVSEEEVCVEIDRYRGRADLQRFLKVLVDLALDHDRGKFKYYTEDIREAYNDMYKDEYLSTNTTSTLKVLKELKGKGEVAEWTVKAPNIIQKALESLRGESGNEVQHSFVARETRRETSRHDFAARETIRETGQESGRNDHVPFVRVLALIRRRAEGRKGNGRKRNSTTTQHSRQSVLWDTHTMATSSTSDRAAANVLSSTHLICVPEATNIVKYIICNVTL